MLSPWEPFPALNSTLALPRLPGCRADEEVVGLFHSGGEAEAQRAQQAGLPQDLEVPAQEDLWRRLLSRLGPMHAAMARIPEPAWRDLQLVKV